MVWLKSRELFCLYQATTCHVLPSNACSNICKYEYVNSRFLIDLFYQLTAELLSSNGNVIVKSSQPAMLRFRSLPVQLARTFLMSIPFLHEISSGEPSNKGKEIVPEDRE
ncbi:Uncharacterized protein TCM_032997 [Theobroma cacao]|uniref:Uncharacterized protein n=1 Tax=Theobroma cacao TaxID=3641 RepID=A0A061FAD5_THECC|nr:Uncharacterized protein TCM_032997 [Theobroma cacao]